MFLSKLFAQFRMHSQIAVTLSVLLCGGAAADPGITVGTNSVSTEAPAGQDAAARSFTVRNDGSGTLNYDVRIIPDDYHGPIPSAVRDVLLGLAQATAVTDANLDGKTDSADNTKSAAPPTVNWATPSPAFGSSTGEEDTINVTFESSSLAQGNYEATIRVSGNAADSPEDILLSLEVGPPQPSTTTIVPNPPTAGQGVRIWYASSGGPIAGAGSYVCHWAINNWSAPSITDSNMVAALSGMWYADVTLPIDATQLDFVFNDGNNNWDNNGGNDWHFAVTPAAATPSITLSKSALNNDVIAGSNATDQTFTIRNGGTGTLNYTIAKSDTGDGTSWFSIAPTSGSSTGEEDTVTVSYNSSGLAAGLYMALITATGNAMDSPQVIDLSLTVNPAPVVPPITIGAGPTIGTNTEGTSYNQEFQDWVASDVRAFDQPDDATNTGDGAQRSRDITAFYSRFEGDNLFLRFDMLDLALGAENGNADVYVLIDCATGGTNALPDGITGATTSRQWDIAVCTYDATNFAVRNSAGAAITNAHLGAYWRSDLDAVEFGVRKSALTSAGWNGSSVVYFNVFTSKDFSGQVMDSIDLASSIPSNNATGRAKFATIAHGNQSLNRVDGMKDRIYISGANTGTGAPSGFRLTLDTHSIFQVPLNIHMSATLISAIRWIKDANPIWDGAAFINKVGSIIDSNQSTDPGALIGGVFSEHIMPFFNGDINRNSIEHFDALTMDIWGIDGSDMRVMHTPERVINSVAAATGPDPFEDIAASSYDATYLDEVSHIRNWLYPADAWTGIGGEYGIPRQHKIHKINGVWCFLINDNEDQYKFWPMDGGANVAWRFNLLYKAMDSDQAQLTLIFDDWEAMAGYSFGSGYNNNALQYNDCIRWVANHPWIEVVTLKEILERATNPSHPQYSASWVVDQGDIGNKPFDTYDYLQHASEDTYANWYNGSGLEETFRNTVPVVDGSVGAGTPLPSNKIFGDTSTTGTIIRDTWDAVKLSPQNNLRELAEKAYSAMIFETAWHDEDNTNYTRTPGSNYHAWQFPDTSYDRVSGWAFTLHNHLRGVTITTKACAWVNSLKTGTRPAGVTVETIDLDQDGQSEYVLCNERIWMAFERRGGRCVQAYVYDPAVQDAHSFLGTSPINNPTAQGEEERTTTAGRCSGFKEMNNDAYADVLYNVTAGASNLSLVSPNGQVTKVITLAGNSNVVSVAYTNSTGGDLYSRFGVSVNNLDLLHRGQHFTSNYTTTTFTQTNTTRGSVVFSATANSGTNQLPDATRFVIPLTEQMEMRLGTGASSFTITAQ